MLKTTLTLEPNRIGEAAIVASRQVWLAGLGAAVVTRDWMQTEASGMFKTLVREGTLVESRAIRFVGDRIETSVTKANTAWKRTRRNVESTVRQAANRAVDIAQQVLPKALPAFELPVAAKAEKPGRKRAAAGKRAAKGARRAKAGAKATTKRA